MQPDMKQAYNLNEYKDLQSLNNRLNNLTPVEEIDNMIESKLETVEDKLDDNNKLESMNDQELESYLNSRITGESDIRVHTWSDQSYSEEYAIQADWNNDDLKPLENIIYNQDNMTIVFYDEITHCLGCYGVMNTRAHSYMWTPNYITTSQGHVCYDCIMEEDIIEEYVNNPDKAIMPDCPIQPEDIGFEKYNGTYTTGLREGSNDDPKTVLYKLQDKGHEVLFKISSTGQFDTNWETYIK